ncbi:MAG: DUF1573 domain-containing protein [Deltaproteobacteria bacterium]|nr:DUF1573 domain-containing protein [Deltaproteobacteria bacterium]
MKKALAVAAAALILAAATSVPCGAEKISAPRMLLEETTFDFQEVDEGDVLEHDFIVKNKGNQPLEIKKVSPG